MADFDSLDANEVYEALASEVRAEAEQECREIADIFRIGLINAIRILLGYVSRGMRSGNAGLITFDSLPLVPIDATGNMFIAANAVSGNSDLLSFEYEIRFTNKMLYRPGLFKGRRMVSPSRADIVETLSSGFEEGEPGKGARGYWTSRQKASQAWTVRDPDWTVRDYILTFEKQYPQVTIDDPWGFNNTW